MVLTCNNDQDNAEVLTNKLVWQPPDFEIHELLLEDILSGSSAINENMAGNNFLSS